MFFLFLDQLSIILVAQEFRSIMKQVWDQGRWYWDWRSFHFILLFDANSWSTDFSQRNYLPCFSVAFSLLVDQFPVKISWDESQHRPQLNVSKIQRSCFEFVTRWSFILSLVHSFTGAQLLDSFYNTGCPNVWRNEYM